MNNDAAYELTSEPKARELSLLIALLIAILFIMMVLATVVEVILLILFVEISKFWGGSGAGDDFLRVALVEYIDRGSIFGLGYMFYR